MASSAQRNEKKRQNRVLIVVIVLLFVVFSGAFLIYQFGYVSPKLDELYNNGEKLLVIVESNENEIKNLGDELDDANGTIQDLEDKVGHLEEENRYLKLLIAKQEEIQEQKDRANRFKNERDIAQFRYENAETNAQQYLNERNEYEKRYQSQLRIVQRQEKEIESLKKKAGIAEKKNIQALGVRVTFHGESDGKTDVLKASNIKVFGKLSRTLEDDEHLYLVSNELNKQAEIKPQMDNRFIGFIPCHGDDGTFGNYFRRKKMEGTFTIYLKYKSTFQGQSITLDLEEFEYPIK